MELVARLRAGDEDAFATLLDRYGATLLRLALMYVKDRAAAEDVVQETWLGVFRGIDRFEERSSFKTWLFTILTNRAKRRGQRDARVIPFAATARAGVDDEPAESADQFIPDGQEWAGAWAAAPNDWMEVPEQRFEARETRELIEAAIATLPPAQREVITLRDIEGWSSVETCNALGITETNQRVLLHRARAKVRRALEETLS